MTPNRTHRLATAPALALALFLLQTAAIPPPAGAQGAEDPAEEITNSVGMVLRRIPAGTFMMGSVSTSSDMVEWPVHEVTISRPFYIGVYEVTQAEYERVTGTNPSYFSGPRRPVERVSWEDAVEFCERLSEMEGETYRLPTEAEWEYACRAGTTTDYYWGEEFDGDYAWYESNCDEQTHDVGLKLPNPWGLYDMSGNVWEHCYDWASQRYYLVSESTDPQGPYRARYRAARGGSWYYDRWTTRSPARNGYMPGLRIHYLGFRVVREIEVPIRINIFP